MTTLEPGKPVSARLLEVDFAPESEYPGGVHVTFVVPADDARWGGGWYTIHRADAAPAPERERLSGECWVNVHACGITQSYGSRGVADIYAETSEAKWGVRVACIRIDLSQHRKGEGLPP
jgi:hypothetical protein